MLTLIKFRFVAAWAVLLLLASPTALAEAGADSPGSLKNQLADHPSPYLALHGQDPVAWQDWGPEVLARAQSENKLILLSSGYFACHWCHVMQRESFRNEAIAEILNQNFIPVKIDRELEPALDKRLMNYAQATLQRGGWPLNVFISPEGLPVYATLYLPMLEFSGLLSRLTPVWQEQSERIRLLAQQESTPPGFPEREPRIDPEWANELQQLAIASIMSRGDDIQGGFGAVNKFPSVPQLRFLVNSLEHSRNPEVIEFLELSLSAMADLGLRDHLGAGFFRYVVDPGWEIPHFEKMLYDNANLALLYLEAGAMLERADYLEVARDTLDFMLSEMQDDSGALVASFSAVDDKDIEGGYYLWSGSELREALGAQEYAAFACTWQIERPEELEAGNHLREARAPETCAELLEIEAQTVRTLLDTGAQKLRSVRRLRSLPTDDKLLASWNGLALSAFARAARQLDSARYRDGAREIRTFIVEQLWNGEALGRALARDQVIGSAAIDDYAYVSRGLFDYARLTGKAEDYRLAEAILIQGWKRFYHNNAWSYADGSLLPADEAVEMLTEEASASPSATLIGTTLALQADDQLQDQSLYPIALSALNRGNIQLRNNPFWYVTQISALRQAAESSSRSN